MDLENHRTVLLLHSGCFSLSIIALHKNPEALPEAHAFSRSYKNALVAVLFFPLLEMKEGLIRHGFLNESGWPLVSLNL